MLYKGNLVSVIRRRYDVNFISKAFYSRRNNPNHEHYYKLVSKIENGERSERNALVPVPNFELLAPRGYRFFLPGNVGPGWHDSYTTAYSLPQDFDLESSELECYAQECPMLLRQVAAELFPGINISYSRLTLISLSQKKLNAGITENDAESIIKKFVLTAQNICRRLKGAGYWADFINPFSGLPCINAYANTVDLYQSDPRFRCLGFQVVERQNCRVIEDKKNRKFIGSLFTTAPPEADTLRRILLEYE